MKPPTVMQTRGFTLVELLVVIVVVAGLAAASMAAIHAARAKAHATAELHRIRTLGLAVFSWSTDHHGNLPRSSHSATGHSELGWQREILLELGYPDKSRTSLTQARTNNFGILPNDRPTRSPAMNVYFELDPDHDDYEMAPKTWRKIASLPRPSTTVLLTMQKGTSDHVMAHYLSGTTADLPTPAEGGKEATVFWADGSATLETPGSLFDPDKGVDRFHPEKPH